MAKNIFYYGTVKNVIVAFAQVFSDIKIITDHLEEIKVPLVYAPKEKFIEMITENLDMNVINTDTTLPRMGFEMTDMVFAPDRYSNPLSKLRNNSPLERKYVYNRVPYDINFNLYLATKKFEESLRVIEQILPFFTPELNVSVKDFDSMDLVTDIPITLNSASFTIDWEGDFEEKRHIEWNLNFTAKCWIYGDIKIQEAIKQTIVNLTREDIDNKFAMLISEVYPRSANKTDPHIINDSTEEY